MALRLSGALRYPLRGERSMDLFVVGGLLGLVTVIAGQLGVTMGTSQPLLAVSFLVTSMGAATALLGYLLRVFETTVDGGEIPPPFRPLGSTLRRGCRLAVLSAGYAILLVAVFAVVLAVFTRLPFSAAVGFAGSMVFFLLSTTTLVTVLAIGYTYSIAVGRIAEGTTLLEAIDIRLQRPVLVDGSYAIAWLIAFLIVVPGWGFLAAAFSRRTIFGVIAVFLALYAHLVSVRVLARGYRSATGCDSPSVETNGDSSR
ncbi:DUF4013 domain-containing protein [Natrialba taiwanensis]|uniref:DUF4013 domain-containing protein n=1 Tax=Natrialba taiwanensis DSM 12281 TaxID=1230458 RepID=L9ZJE6_9EURY|nr:DUF4013 domain-containing protein [Natrialba taiwanensis]ELY85712.1 hypothetical protein C484_20387 [Natrialba taiwanensis DSM 12281]